MRIQVLCLVAGLAVGALSGTASAVNPVSWQFNISTTGQDVFWTSPTAVTTGFAQYDWSYEITGLTVNLPLLGNQNVLSLLEETSGSGTASSLPLLLVDDELSEPTTGSSANIRIDVDAAGFSHASGTNIELGSLLGLPIRRVDLTAVVSIQGVLAGDYNRDGAVDTADYAVWKADFGSTSNLRADGNRDNIVDAADFAIWRNNVSGTGTSASAALVAIPEPSLLGVVVVSS